MPATLAPPPNRYRAPLAEAMRAQAARAVEASAPRPEAGAPAVRLVFVLLAGGYALRHWLGLVDRPPRHAVVSAMAVSALLGSALLVAARARRRATRAAVTAGALLGALVALLGVAGAPGLAPRAWGALANGIGSG